MARKVRRSWAIIASVCLVPCVAVVWLLVWSTRPSPAWAYERIRPGATRAEVASLLGGPGKSREDFSRWLNNRNPRVAAGNDLVNKYRHLPGIEYWYEDSGITILRFGPDDRVADQQLLRVDVSTPRQWFNRLRERLGL